MFFRRGLPSVLPKRITRNQLGQCSAPMLAPLSNTNLEDDFSRSSDMKIHENTLYQLNELNQMVTKGISGSSTFNADSQRKLAPMYRIKVSRDDMTNIEDKTSTLVGSRSTSKVQHTGSHIDSKE